VTAVVLVSVASPADLVELVDSVDVAHPDRVEIADGRSARSAAPAIDLSIIEDDRQQPQAKHANRKEQECSFDKHSRSVRPAGRGSPPASA
jgi:hypothetical protein